MFHEYIFGPVISSESESGFWTKIVSKVSRVEMLVYHKHVGFEP